MRDFVALIGNENSKATAPNAGFTPVLDCPGLRIFAEDGLGVVPIGPSGALLGTLFDRDASVRRHDRLGAALQEQTVRTGGQTLIDGFWGGYVAILPGSAGHIALRDPSGGLALYRTKRNGVTILFSELAPAIDLGLREIRPDWDFVRHMIAFPNLRTARTGIAGVSEILPGTSVALDGCGSPEMRWSPWTYADPRRRLQDAKEAARLVEDETLRCVGAWASCFRLIMLELSGGLDSSVVAACLRASSAETLCATLATQWADGDERHYARLVAAACGMDLRELVHDDAHVDLVAAPARPSVRPAARNILKGYDHALEGALGEARADAFFTGAGGDNIFCYTNSAAPAVDALRQFGPGRAFLGAIGDVATLGNATWWHAARVTVRKATGAGRSPPWRRAADFTRGNALPEYPDHHPWLDAPPRALPGDREHVDAILRIGDFLDRPDRRMRAPMIHPLLSQPLIELCLTIPSWLWVEGGRDRAVARNAFRHRLPSAIIDRRTKGRLESMCAKAFDRGRHALAPLLLEGRLSEEGLLDREAIADYLRVPDVPRDTRYFRLLELADLELWIRSVEGAGSDRLPG